MDYSLLLGVHRSKYALMVMPPGGTTFTHVHQHTHDNDEPTAAHWHSHGPGLEPHHRAAQLCGAPSSTDVAGAIPSHMSGTVLVPPHAPTPAAHFPALARQLSLESDAGVALVSYADPHAKGPLSRLKPAFGTSAGIPRANSTSSLSGTGTGAVSGVFREVSDAPRGPAAPSRAGHGRRSSALRQQRASPQPGGDGHPAFGRASPVDPSHQATSLSAYGSTGGVAGHGDGAAMLVLLDDSPGMAGMGFPGAAAGAEQEAAGVGGGTGGGIPPELSIGRSAAAGVVSVGLRVADPDDDASVEDDSKAAAEKAAIRTSLAVWSGADGTAVPASPGLLGDAGPQPPTYSSGHGAQGEALPAVTAGFAEARGGHAVSSLAARPRHRRSVVLPPARSDEHTSSAPRAGSAGPSIDSRMHPSASHELLPTAEISHLSPRELQQLAGGMLVQPGLFTAYRGGMQAQVVEGPGIYFMGLIDVLQRYTFQKRMERFVKTRLLCHSNKGISAVPPAPYARRFERRVVDQLFQEYHGEFHNLHHDDEEEEDEAAAWVAVPSCWNSLWLRLCCIANDE